MDGAESSAWVDRCSWLDILDVLCESRPDGLLHHGLTKGQLWLENAPEEISKEKDRKR